MRELVGQMAEAVQRARAELPEPEAFVVHRPAAEGYRIERGDDGAWTVVGRQAERAVALSDLTNVEALDEAHRRLRALGVDKALARAGARPGDTVHIGRLAFDYEDESSMIVVTKIGTSSITTDAGEIDEAAVAKFCAEAATLRALGHRVVLVTSGAIAAGLPALGYTDGDRPRDAVTLQAASAVGQTRLMRVYESALASHGLVERAGAARAARLHDPPAVPPRPRHARAAARPRRGAGGQRERRHRRRRDPLRRQRPAGRARRPPAGRRPARAAHRRARASSPPIPGSTRRPR